eukprot:10254289-Lingulodinium_polyedra.AAC.1
MDGPARRCRARVGAQRRHALAHRRSLGKQGGQNLGALCSGALGPGPGDACYSAGRAGDRPARSR